MDIKKQFKYRIALLGSSKVGKTTILNQLVSRKFTDTYEPTIENDVEHVTDYNNKTFISLIIDTFGGDDFPAMRKITIQQCNAFIVVFSFDNLKSYDKAKQTVKDIKKLKKKNENTKILLVGNKKELMEIEGHHQIFEFCDDISNDFIECSFIKVSAKNYDDIKNMFNLLLSMFPQIVDEALNKERYKKNKLLIKDFSFSDNEDDQLSIDIIRSPSLLSLNGFSSDDDVEKFNFRSSPKR